MGVVQEVKDGKFVESNSAQSLAKDKSKVKNGSNLDKDAFLQLLVAQMKYQDPLEPTSNTEYISQFATFSELEQMQNMSATLELSRASTLVGQTVLMKVTDSSGRQTTVQGNVDYVIYENGKAYLSIGGQPYSLDDLDTVADKKYLEAYSMGAEFMTIYKKLPKLDALSIAPVQYPSCRQAYRMKSLQVQRDYICLPSLCLPYVEEKDAGFSFHFICFSFHVSQNT